MAGSQAPAPSRSVSTGMRSAKAEDRPIALMACVAVASAHGRTLREHMAVRRRAPMARAHGNLRPLPAAGSAVPARAESAASRIPISARNRALARVRSLRQPGAEPGRARPSRARPLTREVALGPRYAIRLYQLRRWHILTARCGECGHTRHMRLWQVKIGLPGHAYLGDVEKRLFCQRCGNRDDNRVLVTMTPR